MAITGGVIIPPGLIISAVFGGLSGFLGAFVGFTVATLNTLVVVFTLRWAIKKPIQMLPSILMAGYFLRLIALAGILYGLTLIDAFNMIALLCCFLALYLAHTAVEMILAWKSFGIVSKTDSRA